MNGLVAALKNKIHSNPSGLYVLFYTQMWELFGRYTITALLILYLTHTFHLADAKAFGIYSSFIALLFASPIVGGYLADHYLGSRHAILLGASIMVVGNAMLAIPVLPLVLIGLSVIAVGCGFFLPSIPPLVSAIYQDDDAKRDAGFTIYYLGTNIGALLGPILCGLVGQHFGLNYAFVLSTFGMISGILVFLRGTKHLTHVHGAPKALTTRQSNNLIRYQGFVYLLAAICIPFFLWIIERELAWVLLILAGLLVLGFFIVISLRASNEERKNLLMILLAILALIIFESFLGQGGTTLNLFIDRLVDRSMLGITLPTSFFYALDPIFMLIMGPVLSLLWTRLAKKHQEPAALTKFTLALFTLAFGFFIFMLAAISVKSGGNASLFFVVSAYYVFPIAELCIVPISLSLVTRLSPKGLASVLVGVWMLSNAASGYLTGQISKLGQINFPLSTMVNRIHAAMIYERLFLTTILALSAAAVLFFLIKIGLNRKLFSGSLK